jgi:adenylate cyclase class 2
VNEIETKILEVDAEVIVKQLENFGAKKIYDGPLRDHVFLKEGYRGFFRIREEKERVLTTLKTRIDQGTSNVKVRDEREHEVASKEAGEKEAQVLGFTFERKINKHRVEFAHGNTHFALDTYEEIPTFLEIESPTEEEVIAWTEKLGFTTDDMNNWSAKKLFKHYGKQRVSS